MIAFGNYKKIEEYQDIQKKHREWLKDYESLNYSIALEGKHKIKWASVQRKYFDKNFRFDINVIARKPNRLIIEFDNKDISTIPECIKQVKQKLKELGAGYIESSHKGKSNYLWVEFTRDLTTEEAKLFLDWIAPENSVIDLNFTSDKKVFPVLFAVHWKHSLHREIPLEYVEGNQIDYDSLHIPKKQLKTKIIHKNNFDYEVLLREEIIKENPFKKLHYTTKHLPYFHEFSNLTGLYGRHYIPILKARYYQMIGGIVQKKIEMGRVLTDTRIHIAYPLVTEGGKNELIYSIKDLIKTGIEKQNGKRFTMSQPTSFHPESLIGKYIEVTEQRVNPETGKKKNVKIRVENRGHLNNDFLDFDECTALITSTSPENTQAREILSISENSIGRNEVEKRLTEDTPENVVKYCPFCTNSYYFQPFKKIPEEAFLQGFLRRKIIPVGNVSNFLNYANEEIYNYKTKDTDFSREDYKQRLIDFLEKVRQFSYNVTFDNEAQELIKQYALYISGQAQLHSEKIANFSKVSKYTTLDYLTKMSAIISYCYFQNVVTKEAVGLAYMDLVELMQNTFDFIYEKTLGDFSYGTSWGGASYKQKVCLQYLHLHNAYSEDSNITIKEFLEEISQLHKFSLRQARNVYLEMKEKGLINSKQKGQHSSSVWLKFNPKDYEIQLQGDKGGKGYSTYNYVFQHQNTILATLQPLQP